MLEKFLTVEDVAASLLVSPKTVYSWVGQGKIPHYKFCGTAIRFQEKEIIRWAESWKFKKYQN
jgi:excisionase family DNA binding protein